MSVFPNYGPGERGYLIEMMQIVPIVNPRRTVVVVDQLLAPEDLSSFGMQTPKY